VIKTSRVQFPAFPLSCNDSTTGQDAAVKYGVNNVKKSFCFVELYYQQILDYSDENVDNIRELLKLQFLFLLKMKEAANDAHNVHLLLN